MLNNQRTGLSAVPHQTAIATAIVLAFSAWGTSATAATLSVGPGKLFSTPCQALTKAVAGDVVEIDGSVGYAGDVCAFGADNLTIRGVNGRPKIDAAGKNAGGKGTWVVQGKGTVIDNVEMFGAKVPDLNGAAIRLDGVGLTVRRSYFHDNENGILTNNDGISDILIENTEFSRNGYGDGKSHNLYIGNINSLTFRYNYSHDANVGHNLKSRARVNTVSYNRFSSSGAGQPSYEIDLPNAGTAYVIGNVIHQPASHQNGNLLAYGAEGATNPGQDLYVVNNTFINDYSSGGNFILVGGTVTTPVLIQNNIFAGTGTMTNQTAATLKNNYQSLLPAFIDRANFDLRPAPGAQFIDAGSAPGVSAGGVTLTPASEYRHVAASQQRPVVGAIDIGAYEAPAATTTTSTSAATTTTLATTTTSSAAATTTQAATTTTKAATTTTQVATTTTTRASSTTTSSTTTTTYAPDTVKPTVRFISPADGSKASRTVNVNVAATDNTALAKVTLTINGQQVASVTGNNGSLSYSWNTRWMRGTYTLTATATDTAGNQASASVSVYVRS